jgi:Protein of unknown function (DUF3224)
MHATGTFEVKLNPMAPEDETGGAGIGRLSINKQFFGDLAATSLGQMVAIGTATEGSAGYVAMEVVGGMLHGRAGTFALQHNGTANRGTTTLTVNVVPDSGTGELVGLAGQMAIIIADGKHSYEFDYTLTETL